MMGEHARLRVFRSVRSPTQVRSSVRAARARAWRRARRLEPIRELYESRAVRDDFRHNVHRTDLPVGVQSVVVSGILPANRAAAACPDCFDLRGPPLAVTRFLRGA